ncbi:MAG: extracellular solute-binding protein [Pseudomonadota bacterium]
MSHRLLPAFLLACLLPMLLTGCGAREAEQTTLDFWAMGSEGERVQALLPEFERRHPGIRVRVQQIPWSAAHEKLLTAHVGGTLPDVFQLGNTWLPEFAALRALAPLDEVLPAADQTDIFPGVLTANMIDGRLYGLPWYVDTRLLFYRADLLARAGIDRPPHTWGEWLTALHRVRDLTGRPPLLLPFTEWQTLVALGLQQQAALLRDEGRFGDFRAPAFRAAFAFYLRLFREGLAEVAGEAAAGNVYQAFARGRIAFLVSGPWNLGEFERRLPNELQGAWATAPLPVPDGTPYPRVSIAGGASLAIRADSRHMDAARALVAFLLEQGQQIAFYRETGDLPVRMSAWTMAGLHEAPRVAAFWQQLQDVRGVPAIPEWERIATLVMRHAERAARGLEGADEALAAIDAETDALLEKRRWLMDRSRP